MSDSPETNGEMYLPDDKVRRLRELEARREASRREYDDELWSLLTEQRYSSAAVARSLGVAAPTIRIKRDRIQRQKLGQKAA